MKFANKLARGMQFEIKRIFYDWDGTIVEFGKERFFKCINHALGEVGSPKLHSLKESRSIRHTFATRCPDRADEAMAIFRQEFSKYPTPQSDLMAGAKAMIEQMHSQNILQGVVSNLDHQLLNQEVERLGLNSYFPIIIGSKHDGHLKPKPDLLIEAIELSGLPFINNKSLKDVIYIGDSPSDMIAANAAGCTSILVNPTPAECNADIKTQNLYETLELIKATRHNSLPRRHI